MTQQSTLSEGERNLLEAYLNDEALSSTIKKRIGILLEWDRCGSQAEVAQKLKISRPTVQLWVKRFRDKSVESLFYKQKSGRRSMISDALRNTVYQLASEHLSTGKERWTLQQIASQLDVAPSTVWKILQKRPNLPEQTSKQRPAAAKSKYFSKSKKNTCTRKRSHPKNGKKTSKQHEGLQTTPSLADLAKALNCSPSTVSRALRDDPRHCLATRRRIQAKAREMGYELNPYISTLMTHVRMSRRLKDTHIVLAYLDTAEIKYSTKEGKKERHHGEAAFHTGARKRAEALGYHLERFWVDDPKLSLDRLFTILKLRGIQGVLSLNPQKLGAKKDMEYSQRLLDYSVVLIGGEFPPRPIHYVRNNQFESVQLAHQKLMQHGYQKIGYVTGDRLEIFHKHRFGAGFQSAYNKTSHKIPYFFFVKHNKAAFLQWLEQYQPDGLISTMDLPFDWLTQETIKIPEDIGFAYTDCEPMSDHFSGINQNNETIGAAAVDQVIAQIQRNERGVHGFARGTIIPGTWVEGKTLREAPQKALTEKK